MAVGHSKRRNDDIENAPAKRRDDLYVKLADRVPFVGGSEFSASGRNIINILVALTGLSLAVVYGFWHEREAERRHAEDVLRDVIIQRRADERHTQLLEMGAGIIKAMRVQTYVMTLSEKQKQSLDLAEPKEMQDLRQLREWQRRESR